MNAKEVYEKCLLMAVQGHTGQVDKLGKPYIEHPIRVSMMLDDCGYLTKGIALIHDVFEDCDLSKCDTITLPGLIINIVDLLTHKRNVSYKDYIKEITKSTIASRIKIADLLDNSDPKRLDLLYKKDPKTAIRLARKYAWALWYIDSTMKRKGIVL